VQASKRSQILATYLKASNSLVLSIFLISSAIYFFVDHQIGEMLLFWGLLIMAATPFMRTLLLFWIYRFQKKTGLAVVSFLTLVLVLISGIFLK
jgi:hypothetical protein